METKCRQDDNIIYNIQIFFHLFYNSSTETKPTETLVLLLTSNENWIAINVFAIQKWFNNFYVEFFLYVLKATPTRTSTKYFCNLNSNPTSKKHQDIKYRIKYLNTNAKKWFPINQIKQKVVYDISNAEWLKILRCSTHCFPFVEVHCNSYYADLM